MKLSKFLSIVTIVTSFSLLYVYQQAEVFRFAYLGQRKQAQMQELLDKNTILRYNINRSGSLVNLGDSISNNNDFQMPESYNLIRLASSEDNSGPHGKLLDKETVLSRFFSIKRQAEAKTIYP